MKSCDRKFIWPLAGIVLGVLVSMNPFWRPHVTLAVGIAAWFTDVVLVLMFSAHSKTAPVASLVAGLFLAVPSFHHGSPLSRALLMCCMAFPLAIAALPLFGPITANLRERLTYLFTWLNTREVKRRARTFDVASLIQLIAAIVVLIGGMVSVKAIPAEGSWFLARWLAGGIMIFAFAEMVTASHDFLTALMGLSAPALMRSPYLSTSISEFWTLRWNPAASFLLFRTFFFTPLARRGPAMAMWAAFAASAVGHMLLPYMASGRWDISLMCGAFFLVQPPLIAAERWMNVRRWRPAAARVWTLTALAITSPLFVEPALQIVEPSWGPSNTVLPPTIAVLGSVLGMTVFFSLGSLAASDVRYSSAERALGRVMTRS